MFRGKAAKPDGHFVGDTQRLLLSYRGAESLIEFACLVFF